MKNAKELLFQRCSHMIIHKLCPTLSNPAVSINPIQHTAYSSSILKNLFVCFMNYFAVTSNALNACWNNVAMWCDNTFTPSQVFLLSYANKWWWWWLLLLLLFILFLKVARRASFAHRASRGNRHKIILNKHNEITAIHFYWCPHDNKQFNSVQPIRAYAW